MLEDFYPRSPRGERRRPMGYPGLPRCISIHAPREGSDCSKINRYNKEIISIHAPREGSDLTAAESKHWKSVFLSTLPARGATAEACSHPPATSISIHAPREGSDIVHPASVGQDPIFLSTLPARGATVTSRNLCFSLSFLSTLPARGATSAPFIPPWKRRWKFLSTLPARGATEPVSEPDRPADISIHAPREGSDWRDREHCGARFISIHAPREGSDMLHPRRKTMHSYFYPRSPRGERQSWTDACASFDLFLSTLPARGATYDYGNNTAQFLFLSTLPARGATLFSGRQGVGYGQFLSTLPARGATQWFGRCFLSLPISIHAPREGSDGGKTHGGGGGRDFYPRSPRGERRTPTSHRQEHRHFYPRSPRGERRTPKSIWTPGSLFLSTLPARGATLLHVDYFVV